MYELTLEWQEEHQIRRETVRHQQPSKYPGTVRLGRDPARCDIVLNHPTVSGLHVEIFFKGSTGTFVLRNLRDTNPPIVDGRQILQGETPLYAESAIYLGQVALKVVAVSLHQPNNSIPPTILMPPTAPATAHLPAQSASYGLQCSCCRRVSPYERMDLGCQWCGTSLAAAPSVLVTPNGN